MVQMYVILIYIKHFVFLMVVEGQVGPIGVAQHLVPFMNQRVSAAESR